MSKLYETLLARIEAVASAERITKAELGAFSREALEYLMEHTDVDVVNRMITVLTPVNRLAAIEFFSHFLPWTVEKDKEGKFVRFGKMMKGTNKVNERFDRMKDFLKTGLTIWDWADENITVSKKDLQGTITKAIKAGLKGHEKSDTDPLTHEQVMNAVIAGGVTVDDLIAAMTKRVEEAKSAGNELNEKIVQFAKAQAA